ncbi:flagellar biosynthesis protein FlhF [Halonatronum saccharophilum]|uniref:flagellar biosynthesis protein FlhF n=1 Tax=Halonatronum saccharophilum TaxID=150060 RepID=UPI0004875721|nr:flagellar biosynthesis protein FlhF [Halonatronum saccharophilum]
MKVKKYQGENMQETILKVKSDLGSNAIILNTRKFKKGGFLGFFAKTMVEVIATVEEKSPQIDNNGNNNNLKSELKVMREMMNNLMGEIKESKSNQLQVNNPSFNKLYEALWEVGMSRSTSRDLADKIVRNLKSPQLDVDEVEEILRDELIGELGSIKGIELEEGKTKVIAFVGPTGVGKTTTLAKLAADFSLFKGKKVGLVTADTYRIAAVDQLKTYSEIINLPIKVAFTPQELNQAIEEYKGYDLVLVDTAGRSQNNQLHISELKGFLAKASIDEICLVLSATTKTIDLLKIIDVYKEANLDKLIVTKIDETDSYGTIFEAVVKSELPLSYLTLGQGVPEDIDMPKVEVLADNIVERLEL